MGRSNAAPYVIASMAKLAVATVALAGDCVHGGAMARGSIGTVVPTHAAAGAGYQLCAAFFLRFIVPDNFSVTERTRVIREPQRGDL